MNFTTLATDYDGTLAEDGHVSDETAAALVRFREAGGKVVLVTGRELPPLLQAFPQFGLCDLVVAENGAILFWPESGEQRLLGPQPDEAFLAEVRRRGMAHYSVGQVIFASWRPCETVVLEIIQQLGLELQIIFNKDAVMVLPSGINKATGLEAGLMELQIDPQRVIAIGDAENDHSFFELCGYAVAVQNALPAVKERADFVTARERGDGVIEAIDRLLAGGLPAAKG